MDWLLKKSNTVKVNFKLKVVSVESIEGDSGDVYVVWKRGNKKVRTKTHYLNIIGEPGLILRLISE